MKLWLCAFTITLFLVVSHDSSATPLNSLPDETSARNEIVSDITVITNPIFDESAKNAIFIHRWANTLHINTRKSAILDKLSFKADESPTQSDLEESERILRAQAYIRDSKIYFAEEDSATTDERKGRSVVVETWDTWSLLPTFDLGRGGGNTKFSVGIEEANLLGSGTQLQIKYKSNDDRTGYWFAFHAPLDIIEHAYLAADFHDNSDGQASAISFYKPFHTLDSEDMYSAGYLDDTKSDTLRQNGMEINEFEHHHVEMSLNYGWLLKTSKASISRLVTGITLDRHSFDNVETYPDSPLPQDRDFLYPWISYQSIQDDFRVLQNIHLIALKEDFNLGWKHNLMLGLETRDRGDHSPFGYHVQWETMKGLCAEQNLLLLLLNGEGIFSTSQKDYFKLNAQAEYFYQFKPKWTAYSKVRLSTSGHNYLDNIFALGDDTGVRGYPNDYQHGDHQWLLTGEIRHYPHINLYQLIELGWAAFFDAGRATGGPDEDNEVSGPIGSIGIGARIYSSHSSYGNVLHFDLTHPLTSGEEISELEWRVEVRHRF